MIPNVRAGWLRRSSLRDSSLCTLFHGFPTQERSYRFNGLMRSENSLAS